MKILYFIKENGEWHQVDWATYQEFDGEKEIRTPTYGTMLVQSILQSLRW